jgi:hypothetical protein
MLEGVDEVLIERVKRENIEFYRLLEEHQQYEVQLASYNDLQTARERPHVCHSASVSVGRARWETVRVQ